MKHSYLLLALLLVVTAGCDKSSTESDDPASVVIAALTNGIWEISPNTEVGQIGIQLKFLEDGRAQGRESSSTGWYAEYLQWSLNSDGTVLTMMGTDGPGTMDVMDILELTGSIFRGRITNSTSSEAIGHVVIMFKAE